MSSPGFIWRSVGWSDDVKRTVGAFVKNCCLTPFLFLTSRIFRFEENKTFFVDVAAGGQGVTFFLIGESGALQIPSFGVGRGDAV